ncbi:MULTISPECIES: beta-mannosidase [unclassified Nocardia]|uniref:beta-mannosidase n=1 Tax=unclassified Nocardia TaxID=2637762 RepID=UPI001CE4AE17|nr:MULTISPECIES: beta-mannosidase [unclassified Nocardia]
MTRFAVRSLVATLALIALAVPACGGDRQSDSGTDHSVAVRATADGFRLRDKLWWPSGFDAPQLGTNWSLNYGCGAQVDLDAYFGRLPPDALTRFNVFQALAVDKTTDALDFRALDAVFRAAERHRQLVIAVLAPQDGGCDDQQFKQRQWYADGWTRADPQPGRAVMSFRDWVGTAVARWHDVPVLAGWELVGEPETSVCTNGACDLVHRTCPPDAARVLRRFIDDAGAIIRAKDPGRLIFAGFTGGGQCGTAGDDYRFVGASPHLDVLDYHDYSPNLDTLPGDAHDGLAVRLRQARELGKPLLLAEVGMRAGSCRSLLDRRRDLETKLVTDRNAGVDGALIWAYVPDPRLDECSLDVGPDDPLWSLVDQLITVRTIR